MTPDADREVAIDREQLDAADRAHRRRARQIGDERDLAEECPGPEARELVRVGLDDHLAIGDDVHRRAGLALAEQHRARRRGRRASSARSSARASTAGAGANTGVASSAARLGASSTSSSEISIGITVTPETCRRSVASGTASGSLRLGGRPGGSVIWVVRARAAAWGRARARRAGSPRERSSARSGGSTCTRRSPARAGRRRCTLDRALERDDGGGVVAEPAMRLADSLRPPGSRRLDLLELAVELQCDRVLAARDRVGGIFTQPVRVLAWHPAILHRDR